MNKEKIIKAVKSIQSKTDFTPDIAIVLGSGLGKLADFIENPIVIPYEEIEGFPKPTVAGHGGKLVLGKVGETNVAVMQGRVHYYEGYSMADIGFPIRVMQRFGIEVLIVTNAAGAVNPAFEPGDVMLITDGIIFDVKLLNPMFNFLLYLIFLVPLAKLFRTKIVGLLIGVGPLDSWLGRRWAKTVCNMSDDVFVREDYSAELLKEVGVAPSKITIYADAALVDVPANDARVDEIMKENGLLLEDEIVGINVNMYLFISSFVRLSISAVEK